jgi:hypothetical protein
MLHSPEKVEAASNYLIARKEVRRTVRVTSELGKPVGDCSRAFGFAGACVAESALEFPSMEKGSKQLRF